MRSALPLVFLLALADCDAPRTTTSDAAPQTADAPAVSVAPMPTVPPPNVPALALASESRTRAARLAGDILVGGHAMDYLRELTTGYGARLTGSETYARAAAWAMESFRRSGVEHVALEPFTMAASWSRRPATFRVVSPELHDVRVEAIGWSPPTPPEGVQGELVYVEDASPAALRAKKDFLRGKIALIERKALMRGGKLVAGPAYKALGAAGAIGVLRLGARDNGVLGATAMSSFHEGVGPIPGAVVGKEDGLLLRRLVDAGPVRATFTSTSPLSGPAQVPNVVAEIRGREKPDEWVLVCAHLDDWDFAAGAQDNGSGVAEVLEAARAIHALGVAPRRSIRFALWAGEEQWLYGSDAYATAHAAELDKAVLVLNTDNGAGAVKGWHTGGRDDVAAALRPIADELLASFGASAVDPAMEDCDTDDCPFVVRGVPAANLFVDMRKYDDVHHTPGDTLDKVDPLSLATAAAVVAITAYAVADAEADGPRRLGRGAVAASLKKLDLAEELMAEDYWKP